MVVLNENMRIPPQSVEAEQALLPIPFMEKFMKQHSILLNAVGLLIRLRLRRFLNQMKL